MRGALRLAACAAAVALACTGVDPYPSAVERGQVALDLGDSEDAADAYRAALAARPNDARAMHGLARSYVARGDGEAALDVYFRLKGHHPVYYEQSARADYHEALYEAAHLRLARDDPAMALRYLRRLHSENPSQPGLPELLTATLIAEGGRLQVAGRPEEAEALFLEARGRDPEAPDPAAALAEALIEDGEDGQLDTAISILSDALLHNPDDRRLRRLMDRALELRYPNPIRVR